MPTRAYCAAFTALGVVTQLASESDIFVHKDEHFECLLNLRPGTAVHLEINGRKVKGIFEGAGSHEFKGDEHRHVKIRVKSRKAGGQTRCISAKDAHKIEVLTESTDELPDRQKGHRVTTTTEFADRFFPQTLDSSASSSEILCAIVGRASALVEEIRETKLTICDSDEKLAGSLQDVIRIRSFSGEREHFLADVLPSDRPTSEPLSNVPPVVLFDGAAAFLSRRNDWRDSNWIVLVDRTEPNFESAVDVLNQDYLAARTTAVDLSPEFSDLPDAPPSVELFAYRVKGQ